LDYRLTPMPYVSPFIKKDSSKIKDVEDATSITTMFGIDTKENSTMVSTPRYSHPYSLLSAILLLTPFAASLSSSSVNSPPKVRIQVCQNKDCCRGFQGSASLLDTLHDLIPPGMAAAHATVESTGCLSRCETGPNICIQKDGHPDNASIDLQGVENAAAAAMHLQTTCDVDVPPKLIAAVKVMEKAQKGM
jgi:predicted metal-binding protein